MLWEHYLPIVRGELWISTNWHEAPRTTHTYCLTGLLVVVAKALNKQYVKFTVLLTLGQVLVHAISICLHWQNRKEKNTHISSWGFLQLATRVSLLINTNIRKIWQKKINIYKKLQKKREASNQDWDQIHTK